MTENRLTRISGSHPEDRGSSPLGGVESSARPPYVYDALGRRIAKIAYTPGSGYEETHYYYDGQNVILETDENDVSQRYFVNGSLNASALGASSIDERVLMHDAAGDEEYYYQMQELYTVAGLADRTGVPVETCKYDAYGEVKVCDASGDPIPQSVLGNPYHFAGRRLDFVFASGTPKQVYHYRARSYDPCNGRFNQRDPIALLSPRADSDAQQNNRPVIRVVIPTHDMAHPLSMNLYEYVRSNPGILVDPSGGCGGSIPQPQPPEKPKPPPRNPSLFNPCGCRVYRQELDWSKFDEVKEERESGDVSDAYVEWSGHTWIHCGGSGYDHPKDYEDNFGPHRKETIWGTSKALFGTIKAGPSAGKKCACAKCKDIKSCLQAIENRYASCSHTLAGGGEKRPPAGEMNCRYFIKTGLSSCCLVQNVFPDRIFGIGPEDPLFPGW